jgi:hypothetical protein
MATDETGRQETEAEPGLKPVWVSILLIALGWAIGCTVGPICWAIVGGTIVCPICWAIGGLITGLALRRAEPSLRWRQVLTVTVGGAIAGAFFGGWAIGESIGWGLVRVIGGAIAGAIGGGVTLWQLERARRRVAVARQGE